MNIYVISDTHFFHKMLSDHNYRPIGFTEKIITNWNNVIKDDDLVIHLGDIAIGSSEAYKDVMTKLTGRKILVRGNHDRSKSFNYYIESGFDFACDNFTWNIYGKRILFTHMPYDMMDDWELNIHGHMHQNGYNISDKHYKFALEKTKYMPKTLKTIVEEYDKWERNNVLLP